MNWKKIIKTLILIIILGLIFNGVTLLIAGKNIVDLAKYWIASVTQLILEISPAPTPAYWGPIITPGPIVEEIPEEKIVEKEMPPEKIVEAPPEKIVEIPKEIPFEAPPIVEIPIGGPAPVIEWPTYGVLDVVSGISGLVPWSVSTLTQTAPELPQTTDRTPTFSGKTSIPYALIFLEIYSEPIVTGETQADETGYWVWVTPEILDFGTHTLKFTAQDPENPLIKKTGSQKFEVVSEEYLREKKKTLFDLSLTIGTEYKEVYPGDDLMVKVEIIKFGPEGRIDLPLHYQIKDLRDEIILDYTETMVIETRLSFLKTFYIAEGAKLGEYKVFLEIPYQNTFISSFDSFKIVKRPIFIIPGKITLTASEIQKWMMGILGFIALILLATGFILWREYKLIKKVKRISPSDLRRRGGVLNIYDKFN